MPYEILFTESKGPNGIEYAYVKPPEQGSILRINTSLKSHPTFLLSIGFDIIKDIFLPNGYPESVSQDYFSYQIWDTIQAFCSTISNTLTTQAILKGVGVGDNIASPVSAAITWILKDGTGMVARIVFAWMSGTALDAECKKWRIFADLLNDFAMFVELLLLPIFPSMSLSILCVSTSMKAIVGVAGGATRAAITQHQAIRGNMGDVSAKDGSQETCVNLLASFVGVAILSYTDVASLVWQIFFLVTFIHIFANYCAVKSLTFRTLNQERLNIIIKQYLREGVVPSPTEVNKAESILPGFGLSDNDLCGFQIKMGHSAHKFLKSHFISSQELKVLINLSKKRKYMLFPVLNSRTIYVFLSKDHSPVDDIEAYFHAVFLGLTCCQALKLGSKLKSNCERISSHMMELSDKYQCEMEPKRLEIDTILSLSNFVKTEFELFRGALTTREWKFDHHNLRVNKWLCSWGSDEQFSG